MGVISGQSSPVWTGPCRVQKTEILDRTLPGLTPPLILITEGPRCLQALCPLVTLTPFFS